MRFINDTATGNGRLKNTRDSVMVIEFHARFDNTGYVYVGESDVTTLKGREIPAGESVTWNLGDGSILLNTIYAHIGTPGDKLDWTAFLR